LRRSTGRVEAIKAAATAVLNTGEKELFDAVVLFIHQSAETERNALAMVASSPEESIADNALYYTSMT
jgi:hypothetical protein